MANGSGAATQADTQIPNVDRKTWLKLSLMTAVALGVFASSAAALAQTREAESVTFGQRAGILMS